MDYTDHGVLQSRILEWGSHFLLQGIFPAQGSNPGLPHCRWILYQLSHKLERAPDPVSGSWGWGRAVCFSPSAWLLAWGRPVSFRTLPRYLHGHSSSSLILFSQRTGLPGEGRRPQALGRVPRTVLGRGPTGPESWPGCRGLAGWGWIHTGRPLPRPGGGGSGPWGLHGQQRWGGVRRVSPGSR